MTNRILGFRQPAGLLMHAAWVCLVLWAVGGASFAYAAERNLLQGVASVERTSERDGLGGRPTFSFTTFPCEGMGMLFERILVEAYDSIGCDAKILRVPAERALVMSNSGKVDGEAARVPVIETKNANLIRVPTPLYTNTVVAYTKRLSRDMIKGWEDFEPYKIGMVIGYKFIEKKTAGMDRTVVTCYEKLFAMLAGGRVDVVVVEYFDSLPSLKSYRMDRIKMLEPALAYNPMYHYLHKKHADLVPKIDAALKRMHEQGRMEGIMREMLEEFESR